MRSLKTVFMGTPEFAVPSLEALIAGPDDVVLVVTQPDRPSGRGRRVSLSPVKRLALEAGVPISQPERIRGEKGASFREMLRSIAPDLVVVAAFGQILPREVLEIPALGCVNVHASLLPRWRGASPIQWAIAEGDAETGISIMKMDEGLDTGPVILRRPVAIEPHDTGGTLHDRLATLGSAALMEGLDLIRHGKDDPKPQDDEASTYAPMLSRDDGRLDFALPAEALERRVRAFQPWPGAFSRMGERMIKVLDARLLSLLPEAEGEEGFAGAVEAGTIVSAGPEGIDVVCGEGILRLTKVQPEGKRPMTAAAFAVGRRENLVGSRVG